MFGLSFLTTLSIYKDYFEGRKRLHKCEEKYDWKPSLPYFIFLLKKLLCLYTVGFCDQGAS